MSVEEWFTMELLDVQDGRSFKTTAQSLLWAALISDQRLQHSPDHIQLYRGTDGRSRWKDIKSLMQSWTSLLSTRSATPRQTRFISPFWSCHLNTGGGFSFAFWSANLECINVLMEGIQVSKPYWTCQTGVKRLVCISALGFHLELCVCVSLYSNTERLHSLFGSNCPVHNIRQQFSNFLMQVPKIWSPCERQPS